MKNIKIVATGSYLPQNKVDNKTIANELKITEEFIYKRTGIKTRYFPAKVILVVERGRLLKIGSLKTCTRTFWPILILFTASVIFSSTLNSSSIS